MAMVDNGDQQSSDLHFCKVCKRGFGCGEALGGHMRAHGITDVQNYDEEPPPSSFLDHQSNNNNKHPYFLRTTANRFLSCKAREAKCILNEMGSPISWPAKSEYWDESYTNSSEEEEDLANCLVMLSKGPFVFSINKEEDHMNITNKEMVVHGKAATFQCKACKKVFNSHQALGGHRASHKKVKGCFASGFDNLTEEDMLDEDANNSHEFILPSRKRAPWEDDDQRRKKVQKVHECSICYRTFSSGQALGGHKRCHWLTSNNNILPNQKEHVEANNLMNNDQNNSLKFEALTRMYLPARVNGEEQEEETMNNKEVNRKDQKLEKISNLREMDLDGQSSTWLQMGIASTTY